MAGERGAGHRLLSLSTAFCVLACLMVACAGRASREDDQAVDPRGELTGLWLRPARNAPTPLEEGLDIRAEGIFFLVGIHSMDGLTWRRDGASVALATATERYPAPFEITHRIERLTEATLVLSGGSYLAGHYTRASEPPPRLAARRRAAAIDANRDRYCSVSRRLVDGASTEPYTAYYYEVGTYDMSLRLIDATQDTGVHGSSRARYFFENDRLFYYRSEKAPNVTERDPQSGRGDLLLSVSYDPEGAVAEVLKVVDGLLVSPTDEELRGIQWRLERLLSDLRRTSECRRTAQQKRRDKRVKRLRERLGGGRGGH